MSENKLLETLELAGISDCKSYIPNILSEGITKEKIKKVHLDTNSKIQEMLTSNSLGECIHITGEMRALTDPFHRYICEQINSKSEDDIFKIVYNLPEAKMNNTTQIIEWNLNNWAPKVNRRNWSEELQIIYSIANRSVNLYNLDTSQDIQYSVFGNKYILLQEQHKDKAETKHTWFLESEALNAELTIKANLFIKKSNNIDEGHYGRFAQNVNGIASKRLLRMLNKKILSKETLLQDTIANDFTDSIEDIIESLKIMNFINENSTNNSFNITTSGKEFLF